MSAMTVLVAAALLVAYIIIGYPLILCLRRRRVNHVHKDPSFRTSVSVVIAVRDGETFIRQKLLSVLALRYPSRLMQILVVSDGSTDGTDEIVSAFAGQGVELLRVPRRGKAAALNAALERAQGEILFYTDVRQPLHPDALAHLAANFADPSVGAVTGELQYLSASTPGVQADLELYWRYEVWARRRHSEIDSIFNTTGCIYAVRRCLAEPIPTDTLADDAVIPLRAFFHGYRVIVDREAVAYDYPAADAGELRRKLRTLAGLWQAHVRQPALFTRANRMRFHFLSHKFARLALPWAVLLIWASTLALPSTPLKSFLIIDELTLVGLALLDSRLPKWMPLKHISSPARTFLAKNIAALFAVSVFFVRPEKLWRPTEVIARPRAAAAASGSRGR